MATGTPTVGPSRDSVKRPERAVSNRHARPRPGSLARGGSLPLGAAVVPGVPGARRQSPAQPPGGGHDGRAEHPRGSAFVAGIEPRRALSRAAREL
jgi:hypothetical protein